MRTEEAETTRRPEPRGPGPAAGAAAVAIIADCHLEGPGGGPEPLLAQLDALPRQGCRHLVLLGDLFQAWIGLAGYETPAIAAVAAALRELRRRGLRIDYIEGNRDFFLADGPYAELFSSVGRELAFEAGGVRYLAVHGDGLNDSDYAYRFWRWLSKSPPNRTVARFMPRALARRMIHSTEEGLSRTNFKHKVRLPEEVIRAYAERRLAEGHDVVLLGHFHEARCWRVRGGEVRLVEAWFRSRRVEWVGGCAAG